MRRFRKDLVIDTVSSLRGVSKCHSLICGDQQDDQFQRNEWNTLHLFVGPFVLFEIILR